MGQRRPNTSIAAPAILVHDYGVDTSVHSEFGLGAASQTCNCLVEATTERFKSLLQCVNCIRVACTGPVDSHCSASLYQFECYCSLFFTISSQYLDCGKVNLICWSLILLSPIQMTRSAFDSSIEL